MRLPWSWGEQSEVRHSRRGSKSIKREKCSGCKLIEHAIETIERERSLDRISQERLLGAPPDPSTNQHHELCRLHLYQLSKLGAAYDSVSHRIDAHGSGASTVAYRRLR